MDSNKLNIINLFGLKKALEERGLSTTDLKVELVERLEAGMLSGEHMLSGGTMGSRKSSG
jgi:hypothetical protein